MPLKYRFTSGHYLVTRCAYSIPGGVYAVIEHINRHVKPYPVFVLLPTVGTELSLKVYRSRRQIDLVFLHGVYTITDRISALLAWMDVEPHTVQLFDAFRLRAVGDYLVG